MNVLMIGKSWNTPCDGGLDRYFIGLAGHMERAGAAPLAMVHDLGSPASPYVHRFGRRAGGVAGRWLAARELGRMALQSGTVDLVNCHFALYAFPLLDLVGRDVPVVCHFHGPWADESLMEETVRTARQRAAAWLRFRLKRSLERAVYQRSQRFIVLSSAFGNVLHRQYGIPAERISVIPGGVDTERFRPVCSRREARRQLGWPEDRPVIVAVRRLVRRMGLENLLDAMALVRRQVPDALLLIGGKGPLQAELQRRIAERDLRDHARLVGFIPDARLPLAYRAADFSVVPTLALEGFGMIVTESLACGTPCIGTNVGGIPEILRPFSESLLFESTQPPALADRLTAVLQGRLTLPDEQACRKYAVSRFAWDRVTQQVLAVFRETQGGIGHEARAVSGP